MSASVMPEVLLGNQGLAQGLSEAKAKARAGELAREFSERLREFWGGRGGKLFNPAALEAAAKEHPWVA